MILWAGQLRHLFKEDETLDPELLKLKQKEQKLTAKAIGKLSEEHEHLLQELRRTRKRLRTELERSRQVDFVEKTQVLSYLDQTAEIRLAEEDGIVERRRQEKSSNRHLANEGRGRKTAFGHPDGTAKRTSSPSRRGLPLRNNYLSQGLPSTVSSSSSSSSSPCREIAASFIRKPQLAKSSPGRSTSPLRKRGSESHTETYQQKEGGIWGATPAAAMTFSSVLSTASNQAKAKYDILPILTSTGESVFEVGLETTTTASNALSLRSSTSGSSSTTANPPPEHKLPVFRLPTVISLEFVNRIPRDVSVYEKALKQREQEEFQYMKKHLGLSTQEIRELEQVLGLRDAERPSSGERVNEVRRFMEEQMMLPPLLTKQLRVKAIRKRRIRRNKTLVGSKAAVAAEELIGGETPRCLKEGAKPSREELQEELERTITVMRAYSGAIKDDVLSIKQLCGISHPRARRFLKQWAAEKLARIFEDLTFSVVVISWERWKQKVQLQQKMERISAYLKIQSSQRLRAVFEGWVHRHMAGAFLTWRRLITGQKEAERKVLESKSARFLQRVFRGFQSRKRVAHLKHQRQMAREKAASIKLQALARGYIVRMNLPTILREAERYHAAIMIQCMVRQRQARKNIQVLRVKHARAYIALRLQCLYRGGRDRHRVALIRLARLRHLSALKIQRMARMAQSRRILKRLKRQQARNRAAIVIQRHIRAMLARCRVRLMRKRNAEEKVRRAQSALFIQRVYRGHRARLRYQLELRVRMKKWNESSNAARQVQRVIRGFLGRCLVKRMRTEALNAMMEGARAWIEAWDTASMSWGYFSRATGEMLAEPPRSGYTKSDGHLVLATGKVINDPLTSMTEEEQAEKRKEKVCVECEEKDANRLCKQCGDKYCTMCYNRTHSGGKRIAHTYVQIGPIDCSECEQETALRWCTSCDDPFCESCWSLIHLRGKRLRHAYCEIDRKGTVSLNAIGPDGLFAGTFKAGQTGDGYGSDYGVDAYASDYPGAEDYGIEALAVDDWAEYMDEQGNKYWYNAKTGMSQWEDPHATSSALVVASSSTSSSSSSGSSSTRQLALADPGYVVNVEGYALADYEGAQGFGIDTSAAKWTQYSDENSVPYWYNSVTGESTYQRPAVAEAGGLLEASEWMEASDEQGTPYYYNTRTGVSQYEYPY